VKTNRDALNLKDRQFNTHLEVIVPKNSQVQVVNAFGEIRVSEINGKLDLSTTHKPLECGTVQANSQFPPDMVNAV
jgi:hypothetical protein